MLHDSGLVSVPQYTKHLEMMSSGGTPVAELHSSRIGAKIPKDSLGGKD
jgi:hypothetical protein